MLYRCANCGAVYFLPNDSHVPHCDGHPWVLIDITARASEYSEAGGEITGIDVSISVD